MILQAQGTLFTKFLSIIIASTLHLNPACLHCASIPQTLRLLE